MSNTQTKFTDRFAGLIELLKRGPLIPEFQITELELNPIFNPQLNIEPQDWWKESFDWFVAIPIVQNGKYGPFYRCGDEHFWPIIGSPSIVDSEKECFFGLEKPKNKDHAKRLYNPMNNTLLGWVHKFTIETGYQGAMLFIGPVRRGEGYQVNPNSVTVAVVRTLIVQKKVVTQKLNKK